MEALRCEQLNALLNKENEKLGLIKQHWKCKARLGLLSKVW